MPQGGTNRRGGGAFATEARGSGKEHFSYQTVMPAKAGIQCAPLDPRFRGEDEII